MAIEHRSFCFNEPNPPSQTLMSNGSPKQLAETVDPGQRQLGMIYARALLGATEAAGQTEAVLEEFDSFVSDVLVPYPRFEAILSAARIPAEEKERIIDRTVGQRASQLFGNFLKVLARHGRLDSIRAIHRVAHELYNELRGRVRVDVITATPLEEPTDSQLASRLRAMIGREPVLARRVDPGLIGGIVLRVGDTVYDGSVATQLQRLSGQIIDRSVHEIQSQRDRFSHSEGN
jgi:F-type H+-transporting ATPase subunit delta